LSTRVDHDDEPPGDDSMPTITTVRAALRAVASSGWTSRTQFELASALGPARVYVPLAVDPQEPTLPRPAGHRGDRWLMAFTAPDSLLFRARATHRTRFAEHTGAELLRLACERGCGIVLEAGSDLERRLSPQAAQAMQLVASYTEALVLGPDAAERRVEARPLYAVPLRAS